MSARITTPELIALISVSSGYCKYEVQDVLEHLAICTARALKQGASVKIAGVGTISRRESKKRQFKSSLNSVTYVVSTKISATLKPDIYLKNALNLVETQNEHV